MRQMANLKGGCKERAELLSLIGDHLMNHLHSIADLLVKLSIAVKNITPLLLALTFTPGCAG